MAPIVHFDFSIGEKKLISLNILLFRIGMRKDLVLNDAEKTVRFKRLIQKQQEAQEVVQGIPSLEPINLTIANDQHDIVERDLGRGT